MHCPFTGVVATLARQMTLLTLWPLSIRWPISSALWETTQALLQRILGDSQQHRTCCSGLGS